MSAAQIEEIRARLAREGIHVSVRARGEALAVRVELTVWSWPHTWLRVFLEFLASGYCVKVD